VGVLLTSLLAACPALTPAPVGSEPTPAPPSADPADWPGPGDRCELRADFADPHFEAREPIAFTVACTGDLADEDATITALVLPSGASFDEAARRFAWTPGSAEVGAVAAIFAVAPADRADAVPEAETVAFEVDYAPFPVPPVLWIEVGQPIPADTKVAATLEVIEDHDGTLAGLAPRPRSFVGDIGIEVRGRTSSGFPKKSYNVEVRDDAGADLDVPLLGLPPESDWVLHGPYTDKTFLRNLLTYSLGAQMGRWQPRTRLTEVFVDGQYQGVYIVIEKIKRGPDRVDIAAPAPSAADGDLSGGYIFKREGVGEGTGWTSDAGIVWDYHYPRAAEVTTGQANYLEDWVDDFESVILGPDFAQYPAWIDLDSWVDFAILQELTRNIDGYKKSSYYWKESDAAGGLLHAGPLWDFNISFGNVDYCDGWETAGFVYETNWCFSYPDNYTPWWESLLMEDPTFVAALRCRWDDLRLDVLSSANIEAVLAEQTALLVLAEPRDHALWPTLGVDLWPNYYVGDTYEDELAYLHAWIELRLDWLDANLPGVCP